MNIAFVSVHSQTTQMRRHDHVNATKSCCLCSHELSFLSNTLNPNSEGDSVDKEIL